MVVGFLNLTMNIWVAQNTAISLPSDCQALNMGSDAAYMLEIGNSYNCSETTLVTKATQADNIKYIFKKEGVNV
jgi:hypothetical protein